MSLNLPPSGNQGIEQEHAEYVFAPANLTDVIQIRNKSSDAQTPSGIPLLKPLPKEKEQLDDLMETTFVLKKEGTPVGTVNFSTVQGCPDTVLIGGFAVDKNQRGSGCGKSLFEKILEQIKKAGFKRAISITASDKLKDLFSKYGREASFKWEKLLTEAKKRYGEDQNLVSLYQFEIEKRFDRFMALAEGTSTLSSFTTRLDQSGYSVESCSLRGDIHAEWDGNILKYDPTRCRIFDLFHEKIHFVQINRAKHLGIDSKAPHFFGRRRMRHLFETEAYLAEQWLAIRYEFPGGFMGERRNLLWEYIVCTRNALLHKEGFSDFAKSILGYDITPDVESFFGKHTEQK